MKRTKLFIGAMLMAAAATASAAVTPVTRTFEVTLSEDPELFGSFTGDIGNAFYAADKGKSFLDIYRFNLTNVSDFSSGVLSIANGKKQDLRLDGFKLFLDGNELASSPVFVSGPMDVASISLSNMTVGAYSLQVSGMVLGTQGGSYGGNVNVSPVPEPETWAMFGVGMAAVSFMSRRRKSNRKTSGAVAA